MVRFLLLGMVLSCFATVWSAPKKPAEETAVVCRTCKDTGKVEKPCPTCRGSKYVWNCTIKSSVRRYSSYWYDEKGRYHEGQPVEGLCGYGSVYKAIHENCKNTRKRETCPDCRVGIGNRASGKVTVSCPDCDGNGNLVKTYFFILNVENAEVNREYLLRRLEKPGLDDVSDFIVEKRLSAEKLEEFKMRYPRGKEFASLDAMKKFIVDGCVAIDEGERWYYVIEDVKRITSESRMSALRSLAESSKYFSYSNFGRRRMTEEGIKDFEALYPNGKLFMSADAFKDFLLAGQAAASDHASVVYYVVRDAEHVTMADKRLALETIIGRNYTTYVGDDNINKRRFNEEELADFKALNPKCRLFTDQGEFRQFIREVKASETPARPTGAERPHGDASASGRRTSPRRRRGEVVIEAVDAQSGTEYSMGMPAEPSSEPVDEEALIAAEEAHEKEMVERKLGKRSSR